MYSNWRAKINEWFRIIITAAVLTLILTNYVVHAYRVEGKSMQPNFQDRDLLLVNKFVYRFEEIKRGDIVVLLYPLDPDKTFLKRVIAEPGDVIQIKKGIVYINNVVQDEEYLSPECLSYADYKTTRIPESHYFVMGDHRNSSFDSRNFGFVPQKYILGKVFLRYWPITSVTLF
ncbi:MAG: signal peptidase I [Candidatus Schekmanbacteria bacterium RBG_13_48_7]|uniref:Signal peptidase I n=1 Tax=Candidatus Schekmanbacteria bacterium RBG_13_48_7 TaxID=1817878 RepID=A0A1F7S2P6_9BACT|nr:MAG: signal peptidase I [Candidatus Schekmanbacteria bacterium RBG_13_48_7]